MTTTTTTKQIKGTADDILLLCSTAKRKWISVISRPKAGAVTSVGCYFVTFLERTP